MWKSQFISNAVAWTKIRTFQSPKKYLNMQVMAKFDADSQIWEVSDQGDAIDFFIYQLGEEQVGQSIKLPKSEIDGLIKHLQSLQPF
jgi:hypothetical protein